MDIVWAVRELCKGENGFVNMFNKAKSSGKLADLTGGSSDAAAFETLLYGKARPVLIELINNAYNFKDYVVKLRDVLVSDGLSVTDANRALATFFAAFGFPGFRITDPGLQQTLIDDDGTAKTEYVGEVRDGVAHGVGVRNFYYEGKWCSLDECVWIDGVMCGYDYAKELEFGMFEDQKMGFVVDDCFVGKYKYLYSSGEESYENGKALDLN